MGTMHLEEGEGPLASFLFFGVVQKWHLSAEPGQQELTSERSLCVHSWNMLSLSENQTAFPIK